LRLSAQDDKGLLKPLSSPKNFFTKNLVKLAAQTRYGAIKSAPLFGRDSRVRGKINMYEHRFQSSMRLLPPLTLC